MGFVNSGTDLVWTVIEGFADGLTYAKNILSAILEVNNDAMSKFLSFLWNVGTTVAALTHLLVVGVYTLLVCVLDILVEISHFAAAFLHLVWKIFILFCSLLELLFHCLQCVFCFLWTGGQWTAKTMHVSSRTLAENGIGTWKYFVLSLKELTSSLIGGFSAIGMFARELFLWIYSFVQSSYEYFISAVNYADGIVRISFIFMVDSMYYFLTDYILSMPKEAYLGVLIFITGFFTVKSIFQSLCNRGLTFPLLPQFREQFQDNESEDYNDYDGRMAEFSDDDLIDLNYDDEEDDVSHLTDSSDDENDDDLSDEELEVNSSDDESVAESESEMSEINIELPETGGVYRRSTTPSRFSKEMTPNDLQKAIENEKERRMCVVCQDQMKSVLILPCRHMCLCVDCGNQIARSRMRNRRVCPLCRTKIKTIMNVYV